jgi:hypothetical protein
VADLTPEDVRRLTASLSLPMIGDGAGEIARRLDAFLEARATLDARPLEQGEPWPTRLGGELA